MNPILECRNLTKCYDNKIALNKINLSLERGKIIGLLGPNGSGKTTLIKLLNGLLVPTDGSIFVDGHTPGIETKKIVSYLPERTYLSMHMKVSEIINYFSDFYSDFDRSRAYDMLKHLNINPTDRLHTMSKGTKEKIQLILVMSRRASLYCLDEPIAGVDPAARDYILSTILNNYDENATILISTHLISDVENILDDVVFIQNGQIRLCDSVDNIRFNQGKSVSLLLVILHAVLIVYTVIGRIGIFIAERVQSFVSPESSRLWGIAGAFYIIGFILFIFAIVIATTVYLAVRIQKNLFSDEGYLTHTLPVKPTQLLWSKVFVIWTWSVIDFICVVISVFTLITYKDTLPEILKGASTFFGTLFGSFGFTNWLEEVITLLAGLAQYFGFYTMLLLFAMCLGNLFKNHKILGTILSFFGLNMVLSFLNTMITFMIPGLSPFMQANITSDNLAVYSSRLMIFTLVWNILFSVIFFLGSRYILTKKLNLD